MPTPKDLLAQFIRCNLPFHNSQAAEISSMFQEREYKKGEHFLKEGHISNEYLFLTDGFMRAYAINTEGNDVTTSFYTNGQIVFEVSSFFNRVPSSENIQALTPCSALSITYACLNEQFHALPHFREFGRAMLVKGFTLLKARMLSAITLTAEERYLQLLDNNPEVFQHAPLKDIATYLGITDTSLSRIRKDISAKY